jgi:hypothetical protein
MWAAGDQSQASDGFWGDNVSVKQEWRNGSLDVVCENHGDIFIAEKY